MIERRVAVALVVLVCGCGTKAWVPQPISMVDIQPPANLNAAYVRVFERCMYLREKWDRADTAHGRGKWFAIGLNLLTAAGSTVVLGLIDQAPVSDSTARDLKITSLVLGGAATITAGVLALAGIDNRQNRLRQAATAVETALLETKAMWNGPPNDNADECKNANPPAVGPNCLLIQQRIQLTKLATTCGVNPITENLIKLDKTP
jgi:hypothetical protein